MKRNKVIWIIAAVLVLLLVIALCVWMIPFLRQFGNVESSTTVKALRDFKAYTDSLGFWKYPLLLFLQVLQIVVAIIPGGPMQILMGFVLGTPLGMLLSLIGIIIATYLIIAFVDRFGMKFIRLFVKTDKFGELRFLQDPVKRELILFVLFLIPGSPKDLLTYFAPLTPIKKGNLIAIVTLARIPSLFGSVYLGATLSKGDLGLSLLLFAITAVLGIGGIYLYNAIIKRNNGEVSNESQ